MPALNLAFTRSIDLERPAMVSGVDRLIHLTALGTSRTCTMFPILRHIAGTWRLVAGTWRLALSSTKVKGHKASFGLSEPKLRARPLQTHFRGQLTSSRHCCKWRLPLRSLTTGCPQLRLYRQMETPKSPWASHARSSEVSGPSSRSAAHCSAPSRHNPAAAEEAEAHCQHGQLAVQV